MAKKRKPRPDNMTFFWVGLCISLFGMCTVGAQELTQPSTYSGQRMAPRSEAEPIDASLLPASLVAGMAQTIPVGREPDPPEPKPVLLTPKQGPNPPHQKLSEAEKAVLLAAFTPECDVHDWLCVSEAAGFARYAENPGKDKPYGAKE